MERVVEALKEWTPLRGSWNVVQASAGVALADSDSGRPWILLKQVVQDGQIDRVFPEITKVARVSVLDVPGVG